MKKKLKKSKKDKDEILKELGKELRLSRKAEEKFDEESEHKEESELEEDVESWNKDLKQRLRNLGFTSSQLLDLETSPAPVLERIAFSKAGPVFISRGDASQTSESTLGRTENNDESTYIHSNQNSEDPKYSGSSEHIYKTQERFDVEQAGRKNINEISQVNQQTFFTPSRKSEFSSQSPEKVWRPERVDVQNMGRQNPVEVEKEKYKQYDPKEFSSR